MEAAFLTLLSAMAEGTVPTATTKQTVNEVSRRPSMETVLDHERARTLGWIAQKRLLDAS